MWVVSIYGLFFEDLHASVLIISRKSQSLLLVWMW